ncbi:hypothetical protein HII36_34725 [Nonomuraea sp. NN258]|uniref:hypothetical protein n=1 Tax=Nonomuraea antri TaxID=2730852 RepID=UPI001569B4FF|nr:hypothetical protein [Nonomuraea antri]NRQ36955.1 hypothetical protein [Nonomuraea antri]
MPVFWWSRPLRVAAVVLVSLTTALTFVRLLEMPIELGYDTALRVRLNDVLYPRLSQVSGAIQALAAFVAVTLAHVERGTARFRPALLAAALALAALLLWLIVVQPANSVFATWTAQSLPDDWQHWRLRWVAGQLGGSVLLSGTLLMLLLTLVAPHRRPRSVS